MSYEMLTTPRALTDRFCRKTRAPSHRLAPGFRVVAETDLIIERDGGRAKIA